MTRILIYVFAVLSLLCSTSALADDEAWLSAQAKLFAGEYDTAMDMAKALDTADGLSLAAETISAKVMLGLEEKPRKAATRARKLAQDALELDPESEYAHIQYALARGFEAQNSSPFRAFRKNLIGKSRRAIEAVREKYPDEPRGDGLMGAWHLGIVRKAGPGRAEDMFNATMEDGIRFYDMAIERSPNDMIILANYAATLMAIDSETYKDKSLAMLKRVSDIPATNVVEDAVKQRMAEFLEHKDDPAALEKLGEAWLGDHNDDEDDD